MKNRMNAVRVGRVTLVGSIIAVLALFGACSQSKPPSEVGNTVGGSASNSGATSSTGSTTPGPGPALGGSISLGGNLNQMISEGPCKGLACNVPMCDGNSKKTTITGKVYDPAGKLPLYNVAVYVPNAPVGAFTDGASCDRCGASIVNPVTAAITDESGSFKLEGAPAGQNVPLVLQVGKWRRQLTIPTVTACADTPLMDPQMVRLPRNKMEGDIPKIAISVGAADQMECLPLRLGIDPAEFTNGTGDGRIHLYKGPDGGGFTPVAQFDAAHGGSMLTDSSTLWSSVDALKKYDIVVLSCEGDPNARVKPMTARQALYDYASQGGRVFASHLHNIWFAQGPNPVPTTGTWSDRTNPTMAGESIAATIIQTFPKGEALAKWLVNVGASTTQGTMMVNFPRDNLQAVNASIARDWITVENPNAPAGNQTATQYMSFNAPIGAADDKICGRAVYTDLHVASVDNMSLSTLNANGFPASCEARDLSAQEKAVAFMLFDLSACVQKDDKPQPPPK